MRIEIGIKRVKKEYMDAVCNKCNDKCCHDLIVWKTKETSPDKIEYMLGMGFEIEQIKNNNTMYFLKGNCKFYDSLTNLCREHDNPRRPKFCDNFPIKICSDAVYIDEKCYLSSKLDDFLESDILDSLFRLAESNGKDLVIGEKKVYKTASS
jgi:Fe-S-cluster containining protein